MNCTHIQCADAGRAARPKPASLPARALNGGLGASAAQVASMVAAVSTGRIPREALRKVIGRVSEIASAHLHDV